MNFREDVDKPTTTDCVICNVHFDNIDDLSDHFQEKHVDELDFVDHDEIKKSPEQMECSKYYVFSIYNLI